MVKLVAGNDLGIKQTISLNTNLNLTDPALSPHETCHLNVSNGNLILQSIDTTIASSIAQLHLARTYNSLNAQWHFSWQVAIKKTEEGVIAVN